MGKKNKKFYTAKGKIIQSAIEQDVIKTLKKFSREEYGFTPPVTYVNKKKYSRNSSKRELKREENSLFYFYKISVSQI